MNNQLLFPMFAHVAWTAVLYVALTVMRAPKAWNIGARKDGSNPWFKLEPKVGANLSNQFEWPIFFYVICILLMLSDTAFNPLYTGLAWVFVGGRLLHSLVQIFTSDIRLRGAVFTINFVVVLGMWCIFMLDHAAK